MSKRHIASKPAPHATRARRGSAGTATRPVVYPAVDGPRPGDVCAATCAASVSRLASGQRTALHHSLLRLQRQYGNRYVGQLLRQAAARHDVSDKTIAPSAGLARTAHIQRVIYPDMTAMWAAVHPGFNMAPINADRTLRALYSDAAAQLPHADFVQVPGQAPQISATPHAAAPYRVEWDTAVALGLDPAYFQGAIIHELAHAASSRQYTRHGADQNELVWANLNLPAAVGAVDPANGLAPNQSDVLRRQMRTIDANWTDLENLAAADHQSNAIPQADYQHIDSRINYALATTFVHNDTVLGDLIYYMQAKQLAGTATYRFARRMLKEANDRRQQGFWANDTTEVRRVDSRAWWFNFLVW